ncbi:MAG: DNA primase [Patescibacteria group bacterium]
MRNIIDEIKSKIDIVDLVSEYIQLKPAGVNFKALCPFHREKTPSFFVSPERQIWHCFGACNDGGDIFKFIMKIEGVEFPEALRILAQKAGVEINRRDYHLMSQRTKLLDITKITAKFYHLILLKSSLAEKAREYLKERGLKTETIKEFQLGFAPNRWDELYKFLTKKGFKEQDIELAGLIIKSSKYSNTKTSDSSYFDRFRNRIMFPINDLYGNPVGFTGRIVPWTEEKEVAKYINTPETPIYNKSRILYGLDKAKMTIKEKDSVILVEGNMDVIACHQANSKNVVASSGTALTLEQVKLLKRYTNNLLLAFDVDIAGEAATQKGINIALQEEMNVKIIQVPEGKDPDECIKENPQKWLRAIEQAKPIMDYYFDLAFKNKNPQKIEDKKAITKILLPVIVKFGDAVERDYWLKFLANKIDTSESALRDKLRSLKIYTTPDNKEIEFAEKPPRRKLASEMFLGLLLKYPDLVINYFMDLPAKCFDTNETQELAQIIKDCLISKKTLDNDWIKTKIKRPELVNYFDYLGLLVEKEFPDYPSKIKQFKAIQKKNLEAEIKKLFQIIKEEYLKKERSELINFLKEAEKNKDKVKVKKLLSRIAEINKEISKL